MKTPKVLTFPTVLSRIVGDFAVNTIGKDEVLPHANALIVSSGTVDPSKKRVFKSSETGSSHLKFKLIQYILYSQSLPPRTYSFVFVLISLILQPKFF